MSFDQGKRRASYGPTSPSIGARGNQTRERIIAETVVLFAQRGFWDTTVHDIAEAAHISRAALYQYFASKDEILLELVDECDRALIEVIEDVGSIGPTADGLAQLRRWVVGWSAVHDRYGPLFVRWAGVDLPGAHSRPRGFESRLLSKLSGPDMSQMASADSATLMVGIVHRYNFLRLSDPDSHAQQPESIDEIVRGLQVLLFPTTPHEIFLAADGNSSETTRAPADVVVRRRTRPSRLVDIAAPLTPRAIQTVRSMLTAAGESFAAHGYYGANVDAIVRQAGFARGTFYKYFSDKLDLLLVLADEFEDAAFEHIIKLGQLPAGEEGVEARAEWVQALVGLRDQHLGVMRVLIDHSPQSPDLDASRERFDELIMMVFGVAMGTADLAGEVTAWSAHVMMIGALDRIPESFEDTPEPDQTVPRITEVVERVLFGN